MQSQAILNIDDKMPSEPRDWDVVGSGPDTDSLSVIIPVFNEEDSLEELYSGLVSTLDQLDRTWEIVFIDDGSSDRSYSVLKEIHRGDGRVRVIQFRRNFGQTAAMAAGFDLARGQIIITMDADLQNDPTDVPRLLAKLSEGYDIVSGWRRDRKDPLITKGLPSKVSNKLASWLTGVNLHDYGCTLKAYRKEVVEAINLYGELHRYIPAVAGSIGADVAEIPVKHHPRIHGSSKYGMGRLARGFLDLVSIKLMMTYITRPMQMFGSLGLLAMLLGGSAGMATIFMKLFLGINATGNPMLFLSMLSILAGIQFISMGFLGEIAMRTYHEAQNKPIYTIRSILGDDRR